jgi:hypothetical protein
MNNYDKLENNFVFFGGGWVTHQLTCLIFPTKESKFFFSNGSKLTHKKNEHLLILIHLLITFYRKFPKQDCQVYKLIFRR